MRTIIKNFLICLVVVFTLNSCNTKNHIVLPEKQTFFEKPAKAIKEYTVKDFFIVDDDLNKIPKTIVQVNLNQPISLQDFVQILVVQGINIIADFAGDKLISIPKFDGELKSLLKSLQVSHGLFFKYQNDVLIIREKAPCYIKVLMPDIENDLIALVKNFTGIENVYYDSLSSRIVFQSDYYSYIKIDSYFKNNPFLTLVIFDVMIIENEEKDEFKNGIDWHKLALNLKEISTTPFELDIQGSTEGSFSLKLSKRSLSLDQVFYSLSKTEDFKVLQSARISTLNGSTCILDVSDKIPYVSAVTLGNISGSSNDSTIVQGYEFDYANNGLVLKIKPMVSEDIVSLKFDARIESFIRFLEVGGSQQLVKQPVIAERSISNQMILNPGETFLIGGLRYEKGSLLSGGLAFQKSGSYQTNESRSFSISVLIRSEILRYIFI